MSGADGTVPGEFQVTAYRCRCGHEWVAKDLSRSERPRVCPKCKTPNWDKPYQFRKVDGVRVSAAS